MRRWAPLAEALRKSLPIFPWHRMLIAMLPPQLLAYRLQRYIGYIVLPSKPRARGRHKKQLRLI
ncbi:MAG: hypothetical protein JOZ36_17530 [Acidobacteria bacterium]|nr:hypothetical protein [Acidobacteriota bacterium]